MVLVVIVSVIIMYFLIYYIKDRIKTQVEDYKREKELEEYKKNLLEQKKLLEKYGYLDEEEPYKKLSEIKPTNMFDVTTDIYTEALRIYVDDMKKLKVALEKERKEKEDDGN